MLESTNNAVHVFDKFFRSTKEKGRGDDPAGWYLYIYPIHVVCMELNRVRMMCEWIQILRNAIQLSMDVYGVELGECLSGRQTENCSTVLTFDLLNDCWIQEIHTTFGCSDDLLVEYAMYWYSSKNCMGKTGTKSLRSQGENVDVFECLCIIFLKMKLYI